MSESAPYQQPSAPAGDYPGKTLGIVGLVLAIILPLVGLIISIVASSQSKKAGYSNGIAKAGIIVGAILVALGIIVSIFYCIAVGAALSNANG